MKRTAIEVLWLNETQSGGTLHRGYAESEGTTSGLFTLESCQKDQAGPIRVVHGAADLPRGTQFCDYCRPELPV